MSQLVSSFLSCVFAFTVSEDVHLSACLKPESEAGPKSSEVAAAGFACGRLSEPEEGVALHRTLPQVFAGLGAGQLEHKGVLLLPALRKQREGGKKPTWC